MEESGLVTNSDFKISEKICLASMRIPEIIIVRWLE